MYSRQVSGQRIYLSLISAISGNTITGQSTGISGRVSADGGVQGLVAGSISEIGGGQYVLNGFDTDFSGNILGFLFTASGCVAVNYTVITQQNISGRIFINSGATVNLLSGNFTSPYSGQLSGQQVNLHSGNITSVYSGTQVNTFSGQQYLNSGPNVNLLSGNTVQLYSGQRTFPYSGQLSGQFVVTHTNQDKSGYTLSPTGLDVISTVVSGVASNFSQMSVQVWRRFFKNVTLTNTQLKTYQQDDLTVMTTQVVSDNGTTQTQGPAT